MANGLGHIRLVSPRREYEVESLRIEDVEYRFHVLDDDTICLDSCETDCTELIFPDCIADRTVTCMGRQVCAHAPNVVRVTLPAHARELGEHAFDRCPRLESVCMGSELETIGSFAFANTALASFHAPRSLRKIGQKAFFHCASLTSIALNEGLSSIGEAAFSDSGIAALRIPGTVSMLGREVVKQTPLAAGGRFGNLAFGENSVFVADLHGGLYRKTSKGLVMVEMLNYSITEYAVLPGTVRIADRAFLYHSSLIAVALPEGLQIIGNASFKYCRNLRYVAVPDSLIAVGEEAFRNTVLASFRIPAGFRELGVTALSTCSRDNTLVEPSLKAIEIDPANEVFYFESGILCRRTEDEGDHAIVYAGPDTDVTIPASVRYVDAFCFGGIEKIEHLTVHTEVLGVALGAFFALKAPPNVTVVVQDEDGSEHRFEAFFPESTNGEHCFAQAFGGPSNAGADDGDLIPRGQTPEGIPRKDSTTMDPATIFAFADLSIRHCFNITKRIALILLRMKDGYFLDESTREMFSGSVTRHLDEFAISCSRNGSIHFVQMLVDLGFIDAENIAGIIDLLGRQKDVKLVSYLLNVQHERFARTRFVVEDL